MSSKSCSDIFQQADDRNPNKMNRSDIFYNCDDDHCNILKVRQGKVIKNNDNLRKHTLIPIGSTVQYREKTVGPGQM